MNSAFQQLIQNMNKGVSESEESDLKVSSICSVADKLKKLVEFSHKLLGLLICLDSCRSLGICSCSSILFIFLI